MVVIPYMAKMSEDIKWVCRKFNIIVIQSEWSLCSMLTKVNEYVTPW